MNKEYITQSELIKKYKPLISRSKLSKLRDKGMPFLKVGGKNSSIFYKIDETEKWLNENVPLLGDLWQLR